MNNADGLADIILTAKEKSAIKSNTTVKVYLQVDNIETDKVEPNEKQLIQEISGDNKTAFYLDINLFKKIGNKEAVKITETDGKMTISLNIPDEFVNTDLNVEREYKVVRIHNNKSTILDTVFDYKTNKLQFDTDLFSTYAVIYNDKVVEQSAQPTESEPTVEDVNNNIINPLPIALGIIALVAIIVLVILIKKKKLMNSKKDAL